MKRKRIIFTLWWMMGWLGISLAHAADTDSLRIAFIADAHVQDVVEHPELVRSMEVQVQSTRLFNENYFALVAALEDVVKRGISLVVLPGDLTDDGQLVNQACVKRLLDAYARRYGISFFVTTGNHDPQRPYGIDCTGRDFLTHTGQTAMRTSDASLAGEGVVVDPQLRGAGYREQMECYASFGFFPQPGYVYWEHPFSSYTYDTYQYQQAREESSIERRRYTLCDSLTATDASYLVEPVPGLWLLAIDGSVHLPAGLKNGQMQYQGSGAGYNNVMQHKPFLLPWVKKVADEAKRRNKRLVAFCHYPLLDFNKGASQLIGRYWGKNKFDLSRVPADSISDAFLEAGIRLHVAGHMHVNNRNVKVGKDGSRLYNIQVPSIAAGIPAYKILTLKKETSFEVSTVVLDSVPGFDSLFPLYEREYAYTSSCGKVPIWNKKMLQATDYLAFCDGYFQDLVRTRFIPKDLPPVLRDSVLQTNERARLLANVILDIYRLRYAGDLARRYIPDARIEQYRQLFQTWKQPPVSPAFKEQIEALEQILQLFLEDEPTIEPD
ncbi:MAG: metallophosphoesterase [Parabacteroides sp.]